MKIIKTDQGQFIKVETFHPGNYRVVWGYRWNRNEERWGKYCLIINVDGYCEVTEADLPKRLPEVEV